MNNQKRLWKTGHFIWIPILLCIVPLFVPSWARTSIPYDEVELKIFDGYDLKVETEISKSLQTTRNIFARPEVKNVILGLLAVGIFYSLIAPAANLLFIIVNLLAYESDWQGSFARAIANELERSRALGHLDLMKATMETIDSKVVLLNETYPERIRTSTARYIHRELDKMLELFDSSDSVFKKHPLVGAPMLIALAQFVAFFEPVAKVLVNVEAMTPELSCKASNILLDYRNRALDARFDKIHYLGDLNNEYNSYYLDAQFKIIHYNLDLYNDYNTSLSRAIAPNAFDCELGKTCDRVYSCLKDDFGISTLPTKCNESYTIMVGSRVTNMFKAEFLNDLCRNKPHKTGFGWLTIKFKRARANRLVDGSNCELFSKCDPFIRLTINGNIAFQTESQTSQQKVYEIGLTYISPKISKKSSIKMELLDLDYDGSAELVLSVEGDVDKFLSNGFHRSNYRQELFGLNAYIWIANFMDTKAFWQDEYDYNNEY